MDAFDTALGWQRLDPRMLLVHPVRDLGRFLPALIGVLVFGRSTDWGGWWGLVAVGVPVLLGLGRYLTTSYRITASRVEVRHGLVNKRVLSASLDRVRTVDVTASPIHRLLGLGHGQGRHLLLRRIIRRTHLLPQRKSGRLRFSGRFVTGIRLSPYGGRFDHVRRPAVLTVRD